MEAPRGDTAVKQESAESTVSLEQLLKKKDRFCGKMLLKRGLMKLEGMMVEWSHARVALVCFKAP